MTTSPPAPSATEEAERLHNPWTAHMLHAVESAWRRVVVDTRPRGLPRASVWVLLVAYAAVLALVLRILTRRIYLGDDTINNYVHVWYISDHLFASGRIPLRFALLDGGHAFTFPYGMAPWTANALIYPLLGDWSVTLFLVLGATVACAAALLVRPALRDPWLLLPFLANPFVIDALCGGQYSFLWSVAGFFIFIWSVESRRWAAASIALWFTASTHPIEGGIAAGIYVLATLLRHRELRRPLSVVVAVSAVLLAPSIYFAVATPALGESSRRTFALSILEDLPRRGTVFLAPFAIANLAPWLRAHYGRASIVFVPLASVLVLLNSGLLGRLPGMPLFTRQGSYLGLVAPASNDYREYLHSTDFRSGLVYRILSPTERKQGAYFVMRRGGVLGNELFNESEQHHGWDEAAYQRYLHTQRIDRVVVERDYAREFATNEQQLLDAAVERGLATVVFGANRAPIEVYDVTALSGPAQ